MSDNYTWGRIGPNSANPEVAANDIFEAVDNTVKGIETRLATVEDMEGGGGGNDPVTELPGGGAVGQILAVQTAGANRVLAWIDPPASGGGGGGGSADYPANPVVGKVLKVKSINPLVVYWATDIVGEGGSGGGEVIEVTFPRAASLTDVSVYGRGSSAAPLTMTDTEKGATFQDRTSDTQGFKTVLKPLPAAPTADAPFEVAGKIIYAAASSAQYNIQGFVFVDAAGNTQIWGLNGSNSGREGNGNASYINGGNWQDGDYTVGNPGQGSFFRMVCDGATFKMYRSQDGKDWGNPLLNYAVSSGRVGIPTRYGFLTHRYSGGLGDLVTVTDAYSTEFPKSSGTVETPSYGPHKFWRVFMLSGSGYFAYCVAGVKFFDKDGDAIPTTASDGAAFHRNGAARPGANAFDNDPATYSEDSTAITSSGTVLGTSYIGFQFNSAKEVAYLSTTSRVDATEGGQQMPEQMFLQYSDDGKAYVNAFGFGGPTFAAGETRTFKPSA